MEKNNRIKNFAEFVVKRRWPILIFAIIIAMAAGSGGRNLKFNNDYHIFFDKDNPQVLAFDGLQEKYTKDDNAFITISPKNGNVFTKETLAAVEELEQMAWQVPYSTRVDALSNYQHTRSVGDDMYVEPLAIDMENKSDSALAYIKTIALREPALIDRLINKTGSVTAVNVTVNLPADSMNAPMEVMAYVRNMVKEWGEKYPDHETHISGIVMMNGAFAEEAMGDMATLVPLMFLLIIITVLITTRSITSAFISLLVLAFSIMTAMGIAGFMGVE
ncbi:MAG: MMPL family transporter [Flavobacteriales bacterium]|nr:MMPL family transporter [Flavobacteriales bacterium]